MSVQDSGRQNLAGNKDLKAFTILFVIFLYVMVANIAVGPVNPRQVAVYAPGCPTCSITPVSVMFTLDFSLSVGLATFVHTSWRVGVQSMDVNNVKHNGTDWNPEQFFYSNYFFFFFFDMSTQEGEGDLNFIKRSPNRLSYLLKLVIATIRQPLQDLRWLDSSKFMRMSTSYKFFQSCYSNCQSSMDVIITHWNLEQFCNPNYQ